MGLRLWAYHNFSQGVDITLFWHIYKLLHKDLGHTFVLLDQQGQTIKYEVWFENVKVALQVF